jgi:hypothetical protein
MTTLQQKGSGVAVLYVGLLLTVVATIAPFVDRATGHVLADHIREGYPAYTEAHVESVVSTWLVILTLVGALGAVSWIGTIWATAAAKVWSRWAATAAFVLGTVVALTALLTKDTSGDVGLAPLLGWIGMLPSVPGLVAVAMVWRRPSDPTARTPRQEVRS